MDYESAYIEKCDEVERLLADLHMLIEESSCCSCRQKPGAGSTAEWGWPEGIATEKPCCRSKALD